MEELSVKIRIAGREYPMKVKPADEEKVRYAGKELNERIRKYTEEFGIEDKQDLLAMVAFDCLVDMLSTDEKLSDNDDTVIQKVEEINQIVAQAL